MDKNQIENRDRKLVNKFRSVVNGKQEKKKRKKTILKWLSGAALVCCAILMLAVLRPSSHRRELTRTPVLKTDVKPPAIAPGAKKEKPVDIAKNKIPRREVKNAESPAVLTKKPSPKMPGVLDVKPPVVKGAAAPAQTMAAPPDRQKSDKSVRIARIVSCKGISNKNFISPQDVFYMSRDKKPVIWMEVYSKKKKLPYTLKHIYYVNGKRYCAVPLKIRHPRMRTWSRITLRYKYQVGKWRVDVVDGRGNILETKRFTVKP